MGYTFHMKAKQALLNIEVETLRLKGIVQYHRAGNAWQTWKHRQIGLT